jgi:RNA polymerase sigma-70 factor, ECF subfamily
VKIFLPSSVNQMEHMHEADPSWLVSQCLAGNEDAIEWLVRHHEEGVFKLALSIVYDEAEAREITQETFLSALRSLRRYREQQSFKAWLYTIAVNHSRSHLRKQKARERLQSTLAGIFRLEIQKQDSPEEAVILNEKEAVLWKILTELDERHRIVLVLRYFHDMQISEIAAILSIHEGTIHSRLHSAREKLRIALVEVDGE